MPLTEEEMDSMVQYITEHMNFSAQEVATMIETKSFGEKITALYFDDKDGARVEVEVSTISPANQEHIFILLEKWLEADNEPPVAPPTEEAATDDGEEIYNGGVTRPEGFTFVGKCDFDTETKKIEIKNLRPRAMWDHIGIGVSASLDRPSVASDTGVVTLRIIHDHSCCAYLFRKDTHDTTHFNVQLGSAAVE